MGIFCSSASTFRVRWLFSLGVLMAAPPVCANLEGNEWIFHHKPRDERFRWISSSRGTPWIPLQDIVRRFHLKAVYDPEKFEIHLTQESSGSTVHFNTFNKRVDGRLKSNGSIAGFTIYLSKPPRYEGLLLCVPLDFGDRVLRPLLSGRVPSYPLMRKPRNVDLMIDPGHGGNDYGATVTQKGVAIHEKDLALNIAWGLRRELEKAHLRVALTREDDSFLTLPERTRFANAHQARLFLSIHLNSESRGQAQGFEVYVLSLKGSDENARAAVAAENQMIPEDLSDGVDHALAELRAESLFETSLNWAKNLDREWLPGSAPKKLPHRVLSGPFYVLYGAEMPSLLLEWGYLTQKNDRDRILSSSQRQSDIQKLSAFLTKSLEKRTLVESERRP